MEPEYSLLYSQVPVTCPYPEPDRSSPYPHIPHPKLLCNFMLCLEFTNVVAGRLTELAGRGLSKCMYLKLKHKIFPYIAQFVAQVSIPRFCHTNWRATTRSSYDRPSECSTCNRNLIPTYWKGKAVPLRAWICSESSRKLRFPDFMTTAQDGGKIVSFTHRPPLPPGNTPGTHFC